MENSKDIASIKEPIDNSINIIIDDKYEKRKKTY